MPSRDKGTPAGMPSRMAVTAFPCDSPAVKSLNKVHPRSDATARRPSLAPQEPIESGRFTMRGVMKMSSSVRLSWRRFFLKSQPKIGIEDKKGTPR